jgi:hypothetical protein
MSAPARQFAEAAVALGPVACCVIATVFCIATYGVAQLIRDIAVQALAKAKAVRYKNGEAELTFRDDD